MRGPEAVHRRRPVSRAPASPWPRRAPGADVARAAKAAAASAAAAPSGAAGAAVAAHLQGGRRGGGGRRSRQASLTCCRGQGQGQGGGGEGGGQGAASRVQPGGPRASTVSAGGHNRGRTRDVVIIINIISGTGSGSSAGW
jgi:hypothetical protein